MDYFVADFGQDKDIIDHKVDLDVAEKIVGHHWKWDDSKKPKLIKYDYAPVLEDEMKDTQKSLSQSEDQLSHPYAEWMTKPKKWVNLKLKMSWKVDKKSWIWSR